MTDGQVIGCVVLLFAVGVPLLSIALVRFIERVDRMPKYDDRVPRNHRRIVRNGHRTLVTNWLQ